MIVEIDALEHFGNSILAQEFMLPDTVLHSIIDLSQT
jgi:hypothetical protein